MQYSLERLFSDADLQFPDDKHEWAKKHIKPIPVSFLPQREVLFKFSPLPSFILHFKKLKYINNFHELFFPLRISEKFRY